MAGIVLITGPEEYSSTLSRPGLTGRRLRAIEKDAEKTAFVAAEFKAASRRIEPDAAQSLVNAVGANLMELPDKRRVIRVG